MKSRLLVVDDDRYLLDSMVKLLSANDFEVVTATNGPQAISLLESQSFNLMILDIGLPPPDGLSVCRQVRTKHTIPVILLTARSDAIDKVLGLEVGADDYITKPFEPSELVARVRAHLRRSHEYKADVSVKPFIFKNLMIDPARRDAFVEGKSCGLNSREFELLYELAKNAGTAISREQLFQKVWEYDLDCNSNSLDVYMYRIRKKIEAHSDAPHCLQTLKGFGYRIDKPAG